MNTFCLLAKFKVRPALGVIGFLGWSALMLVIGSVTGNSLSESSMRVFGISQSQASPLRQSATRIVRLDRERLGGNNLGEFSPYEPESGNLVARGYDYLYSEDEKFGIGVWESKPGEMSYDDLEYYELMYVLDGSLAMTDEHGKTETFGPGEGLVLPKGWSGTLAVPEGGVRKIWVSYMGGKKGS
jgi:uncharacterized cupin superfamily protein